MTIEEIIEAAVARAVAPLVAEVRALRAAVEARSAEAPWVSRAELAEQLSVSVDTIDRKAAAGDGIEVRRIGRRVVVRLQPRLGEDEIAAATREARA